MKERGQSKSKLYKGVYFHIVGGKYLKWMVSGSINGIRFNIGCNTEREAALKYDKKMIENNKQPINILKKIIN